MNQEQIGKFIAELRKEKNMTQQELAEKLNITDRAISNWENGRRLPDYTSLPLLAEVLDISIQELLNGHKMSKEELIELKDTLENIIEIGADDHIKKNKRLNRYIILGNIMFALFCLQKEFNFLNHFLNNNFVYLIEGLVIGTGIALELIGVYNNSHDISVCQRKKNLLKKLKLNK